MDVCRLCCIIFPTYRAATIKKDVIAIVELAIGLAIDINGDFHQIIVARYAIHLRQHTPAVVIHTNLARVDMGNINTQLRQIGISQLVNTRFLQPDFVPITRGHRRALRIGNVGLLSFIIRR